MFSVFLSSYRDTGESLGGLEKAVKALACGSCPDSAAFLVLLISHSCSVPFNNQIMSSRLLFKQQSVSVEELSADSCPVEI